MLGPTLSSSSSSALKMTSTALRFELGIVYLAERSEKSDMLRAPLLLPTTRIPLARRAAVTCTLRLRQTTFDYSRGIARRTMSLPSGVVSGPLTDKIKEDHEEVSRLSSPLTPSHLSETPRSDQEPSRRCTNTMTITKRRAMRAMSTSPSAGRAS